HDEILPFELLEDLKVLFRREIAPLLPLFVGVVHELFVGRQNANGRPDRLIEAAVSQARSADKESVEDISEAAFVFGRQFELVLLDQSIRNRAEILVER